MFSSFRQTPAQKKEADLVRHERGQDYLPPSPNRKREALLASLFLGLLVLFIWLLVS